MSIPTPFNPLGTLGGVTLLDSVLIATPTDGAYENLLAGYKLDPFGSEGYSAEVVVNNITGQNDGEGHYIVAVGIFANTYPGVLLLYSFSSSQGETYIKKYTARASKTGSGWSTMLLDQRDPVYDSFDISHRIRNGVYSGEGPARTVVNSALGAWTAEQLPAAGIGVYICRVPGVSYEFVRLFAQTENGRFEVLPARYGGADGIAVFVDGKLEKFVTV